MAAGSEKLCVGIFGPGLLGGSVALGVRRCRPNDRIVVWGRREEAIDAVRQRGCADAASSDAAEIARGADLIVLATPVGAMGPLAKEIADVLKPGAIVTDVGSVKRRVIDAAAPTIHAAGGRFVGGHPMAGSEMAGLDHARADLFEGKVCILTPESDTDIEALAAVRAFWESLGARVAVTGPDEHDAIVGKISHLPHIAAAAVAEIALANDPEAGGLIGAGFRDTTRVASGDPALWREILMENRSAVTGPLRDLADRLAAVADLLERGDADSLGQFLDHAKKLRDACTAATAPSGSARGHEQ